MSRTAIRPQYGLLRGPSRRTSTPTWICQNCRSITSSTDIEQPSAVILSASEIANARKNCLDMVRQYDTPSSLLLAYIPPHARDAYIALRAFNIVTARTADTTSTPIIGNMRLEFLESAITKSLAGTPPKEPLAILLAQASAQLAEHSGGKTQFRHRWFSRIIETRRQHLTNPPYPSLASLETYAEHTYSTLLYLTLQALPLSSLAADHIASHIGKAAGIVAVLRGLPLLAFPTPAPAPASPVPGNEPFSRQGAVMLPLDIMADAGVREEAVLRQGWSAPGLRDAVFAVATRANDHLLTARQLAREFQRSGQGGHAFEHAGEEGHEYAAQGPGGSGLGSEAAQEVQRALGVFMPAIATQLWLDALQKADFDVFSPRLRTTDWRLPWKAFWAWRRREF